MTPTGLGAATQRIRLSGAARRLFTPGDLNRVLRLAAWSAGEGWIVTELPRRWDLAYARRLGWRQKEGRGWVRPDELPFFDTGTMIGLAVGATPKVRATKGRVRLAISVPVGHALRPETARAFRTVPADEARAVAYEFERAAMQLLETGTETIARGRGKGQLRLSAATRLRSKAITGRDKSADLPAGFVADLKARRARLESARASYVAHRAARWGDYQDWYAALRSDPQRRTRIRAAAAARQSRRRSRLRAAAAGITAA